MADDIEMESFNQAKAQTDLVATTDDDGGYTGEFVFAVGVDTVKHPPSKLNAFSAEGFREGTGVMGFGGRVSGVGVSGQGGNGGTGVSGKAGAGGKGVEATGGGAMGGDPGSGVEAVGDSPIALEAPTRRVTTVAQMHLASSQPRAHSQHLASSQPRSAPHSQPHWLRPAMWECSGKAGTG